MRTEVLWIGFNQGTNGRIQEPGHTLIHAHALSNHSIQTGARALTLERDTQQCSFLAHLRNLHHISYPPPKNNGTQTCKYNCNPTGILTDDKSQRYSHTLSF